ncbi:Ribosomal protein L2 domain 2, partial [Cynara cardunculus var. scolymus]
ILNLSFCEQLWSVGGFSEFPALERLILSNCSSLIEVCESIEQCDGLDLIDLSYCNNTGKLLRTINKVKNVKILKLDGCNRGETTIEMRDDVEETLNRNHIGMNSQTSSSAIMEAIPRAFESYLIFVPSSLVCLSLEDNNLSNESFPMDMSSLSMLKELYLDDNLLVSLPNWVKSLSRLEILSICENFSLKSLKHPPPTLKELRYGFDGDGEVIFNREMSPILLSYSRYATSLGDNIEGMVKEEDMRDVEEKVLRSLGWSHLVNLDFTEIQPIESGRVKMVYEFGIFSTWYVGKEMPNCVSDIRWEGSSISFTIPSSHCNLRGLNFFCLFTSGDDEDFLAYISKIRISNITKMCTWIYNVSEGFQGIREGITYLSHWMFGKNEMEDGDQIAVILDVKDFVTRECGVSLVYDEDEEDVLGYYKSWNHIIGGDLSPFQSTTPGKYHLHQIRFTGIGTGWPDYNYIEIDSFSQSVNSFSQGNDFFSPNAAIHVLETIKADAGASKTYPQQAGTIRKGGHIVIKNRDCKNGQGVSIAVRHIESMIQKSEAHARMHLEDVDMAIRVLLDSFISTQKFGVQKALQKVDGMQSFKKYMTSKKDFNAIVLHLLNQLVKEALHFEEIVSGSNKDVTHIDVKVEELQSKVLDYGITDLKAFFSSVEFGRGNFELDKERSVIRHHLVR